MPILERPVLHVITGSTRPRRKGPLFAGWFSGLAKADGRFEVHEIDLAHFDLPILDEPSHPKLRNYAHAHTKAWSKSVNGADAFAFVMPEYNHGYNAALKNALDYLHEEWAGKPVGFVSYGGVSGGIRAVQQLKLVVCALGMLPTRRSVHITLAGHTINQQGRFTPSAPHEEAATAMLNELARMTNRQSNGTFGT